MIPENKRKAHRMLMRLHDSKWKRRLEQVKAGLAKKEGDESRLDQPLRLWLRQQRKARNDNQMKDVRRKLFETLPPSILRSRSPLVSWEESFAELVSYLAANNGVYPHYQAKDKLSEQGLRVQKWCNVQRRYCKNFLGHNNGPTGCINSERLKRLQDIRFPLAVNRWDEFFVQLKLFYLENGHSIVPVRDPNIKTLGQWVDQQRAHFRKQALGQASSLTPRRIQLLNSVHFVWNMDEYRWNQQLESIQLALQQNPAPAELSQSQKAWLNKQRRLYRQLSEGKKSSITQDRVNRLKNLGLLSLKKHEGTSVSTS